MAITNIMTQSLISANTSMQIARVQHGAKKEMDGHAGVLDAEIKQDEARGGDVKKKKEELEETKKKASELEASTMNTLTSTNEDLKKAAKEDQEARRIEKAEEKKKAEKAAEKKKTEKKLAEERIEKASTTQTGEVSDGSESLSADGTVFDASTINVVVDGVTPSTGSSDPVGENVDAKV